MQVKIANKMRSHLGCHSRILGESEHAKFQLVAIFCLFKRCVGIQLRPPCLRLSIIYFQELNFYYTGNFNKVPGVFPFLSSKPAKLAVLLADAGLLTTWPAGGQHTQQVQPGDGYSSSDLVDVLLRAAILPTKSSRKYWWEGEVRGWSWWVDLRVNRLLAERLSCTAIDSMVSPGGGLGVHFHCLQGGGVLEWLHLHWLVEKKSLKKKGGLW